MPKLKKKSNIRRKPTPKSAAKKQNDLVKGSLQRFGQQSDIFGIFLVRQGLRVRSEQFVSLAVDAKVAEEFCRNTLMPKLCNENQKNSIHTLGKDGEPLNVNKSNDLLLIKTIDFKRTEEGRTNSNPLWYWNIAKLTIITKHDFTKE